MIMTLLTKQAPIDPHDVPLNSLVNQERGKLMLILSLGSTLITMLIGVILAAILDRSHPTTTGTTTISLAPKTLLLN